MKFWHNYFFRRFNSWFRLNMDCEYAMRSWTRVIEFMIWDCSIRISFKQKVESIFFICTNIHWESLHSHISIRIFLNWNASRLLMCWDWRKKIKHQLVVYFYVRDSNGYYLLKFWANILEHLRDASWNKSSVLVILWWSTHCKCLTSACLTITHDCSIITFNSVCHDVSRAISKDFLLT